MSRVKVHRPARHPGPVLPSGPLVVNAPPPSPPAAARGPVAWLPYVLIVGAVAPFGVVLAGPSRPLAAAGLVVAGVLLFAGVALVLRQRSSGRGHRLDERVRYLDHLDDVRRQARRAAELQAAEGRWQHPHPAALWQLADDPVRLWERRPGDPDFLAVRVGLGRVPLARPVIRQPAEPPAVDPVSEDAARRLVESSQTVDGQPLAIDLTKAPSVAVLGPPEQAWSLARAIVAQLAAWHAPGEVRVALAPSSESAALWTWVKWLPHVEHPRARDAEGPARLFSTDPEELMALLGAELRVRQRRRHADADADADADGRGGDGGRGHLVIVVDRGVDGPLLDAPELEAALSDPGPLGMSVIHVVTDPGQVPPRIDLRLRLERDTVVLEGAGATARRGKADQLSLAEAELLGRRLAALRPGEEADDPAGTVAPADVLGFDPEQLDVSLTWKARPSGDLLRAPVGIGPDDEPVYVDLKDRALGGMGPHALCLGAAGSGKTELLRLVVVALAATHSPDQLALLLVDFTGQGTFTDLAELPHVAGSIRDLAADLALVDRLRDTLIGEMQRRQELMRSAGSASVREYETAPALATDVELLPHLVIVVDEFAELLADRPEFTEILAALGRLGSSLGIHLLLAARRFEEDRLHDLGSYLSCRIALRTAEPSDSQAVLAVPDGHRMPRVPGAGYLKFGDAAPLRFATARVSSPPRLAGQAVEGTGVAGDAVLPFTASALQLPNEAAPAFVPEADCLPSTVRLVVDHVHEYVRDQRQHAHQVWLPPLGEPPTLDQLLSAPVTQPDRGLVLPGWPDQGRRRIPIGIVDKPVQQRQDVLAIDLVAGGGNVAVVGGPRSGKTGLLRTLVAAAALTHTPAEIRFYGVDLGGGGLARLRDFPHLGDVASRLEPDHVRRLVADVATLLTERVERFRDKGIESAAAMRDRRAASHLPEEPFGDVVLLIDGWTALRREYADLESVVTGIATRGPAYAVHVALAANRWAHLRPPIRDSFGTRLELRLSDPVESAADREEAANVPADRPGRGLTQEKLHFQVALPRVDGVSSADGLGDALSGLARASRAAWPGAGA